MVTIGLYIGTKNDQTNQLHKKQPWGKYLSAHTVEAFGSSVLPNEVEYDDRIFTTSKRPDGAASRIYSAMRDCQEYLSENNPDVLLQLMRHPTHAPAVALAGRMHDVPVITRYAGDDFNSYKTKSGINRAIGFIFSNLSGRTMLRYSDKIIVLGPYTRKLLTNRGFKRSNIMIVPVCIDMNRKFTNDYKCEKIKQKLNIPEGNPLIFYSGRLTRSKGMEFLKDVITETLSSNSDSTFILAGKGPYVEYFQSQYNQNKVYCPGYIEHSRIHLYYKASDVYIHPSPYEGLPLSIMEALNCGTPVIARNAGDISFVTPNIVETPSQMSDKIIDKDWSSEWKNQSQFNMKRIQQKINSHILDVLN